MLYCFTAYLKKDLSVYVEQHLPIVRLIHSDERLGLIRARILGARNATGDVSMTVFSCTFISMFYSMFSFWYHFVKLVVGITVSMPSLNNFAPTSTLLWLSDLMELIKL